MADLTTISDADLAEEMRRRAAEAKIEQYAPMRATYEPWHGFLDNEEPKKLSELLAMAAAPRQEATDESMEVNFSALRRVLASTKTVWDHSVGLAFDEEPAAAPAAPEAE